MKMLAGREGFVTLWFDQGHEEWAITKREIVARFNSDRRDAMPEDDFAARAVLFMLVVTPNGAARVTDAVCEAIRVLMRTHLTDVPGSLHFDFDGHDAPGSQ